MPLKVLMQEENYATSGANSELKQNIPKSNVSYR